MQKSLLLLITIVLFGCQSTMNSKTENIKFNYSNKLNVNAITPSSKQTESEQDLVNYNGKPNIIFIFTDDHGWPDIGAAGIYKDLKTPHINALAKSGVRATNGYASAPQCVPSRGGVLVGIYQNRSGLEKTVSP